MLSRPEIKTLLEEAGTRPSRALGQNFVADPNTVRKIARLARVGPGSKVVEIGAGLGSLTLALAETGADITAVEIDRRIVPVLRRVLADTTVRVVEGDAMNFCWEGILGSTAGAWTLVANLPYNIATPLVINILESVHQIRAILVMVQKEVGERMVAVPRTEAFGAVSVKISYWATASIVGKVPPAVFIPKPKVDSALVSIIRRDEVAVPPLEVPYGEICELINTGFGVRRKMLRSSLAGICEPADFDFAGVAPTQRPEELGIDQWGRLSQAVLARRGTGLP